jgi:hypothetical protein
LGDAYGMTKRGRKIDFFKVAENDMIRLRSWTVDWAFRRNGCAYQIETGRHVVVASPYLPPTKPIANMLLPNV